MVQTNDDMTFRLEARIQSLSRQYADLLAANEDLLGRYRMQRQAISDAFSFLDGEKPDNERARKLLRTALLV